MNRTTTDLKTEMKKSVELLRTLRDEVLVQIHLGGMDAKKRWNELEPQLHAVERAAQEATEASRKVVTDTVKALEDLRASLRK
ncbi:MAG TPA: hypothetical protein VIF09_02810 [Polyangiaceae bacterium]|jgi:imidazoleglycerol phosphate dehydratase HisB